MCNRITYRHYDQITEMLLDNSGKNVQEIAHRTGFSVATINRLEREIKRYAKKHGKNPTVRTGGFDVQKRASKAWGRPY